MITREAALKFVPTHDMKTKKKTWGRGGKGYVVSDFDLHVGAKRKII